MIHFCAAENRMTCYQHVALYPILIGSHMQAVKLPRPTPSMLLVVANLDDRTGHESVSCGWVRRDSLTPLADMELMPKAGNRYRNLPPGDSCGFDFGQLGVNKQEDAPGLVVWFTDDATHRWELDTFRHLVGPQDDDEYKPLRPIETAPLANVTQLDSNYPVLYRRLACT